MLTHVRFQVVSVAISIAARCTNVRLLQMCFLVLSQAVHVLEAGRACVALHVFLARVHVKMRLEI